MFRILTLNMFLIYALSVATTLSQEFQFQWEIDTIPVIINGVSVHSPFTGGYSLLPTPTFADIDGDGDLDLFVGEQNGNINFYRNTGTATEHSFTFETATFASIDVGTYSAPTFVDINEDGDLDLLVGEQNGNINFFRNTGTSTNPTFMLDTENFTSVDVGDHSTPALADLDDDGDLDLFIGEKDGNINFYRNTGTATEPIFTLETETFASINVGANSVASFVDIDDDGDLDLFVGEQDGNINFYWNRGTAGEPNFTLEIEDVASIDVGSYSAPALTDIDGDGDLDLFVGGRDGNIHFYSNTDTSIPLSKFNFLFETENLASIDVGDNSKPTFADLDSDGDLDLFVGEGGGNINFYRNTGTTREPIFTLETENFASIDVGRDSAPTFADIDNDEDLDMFVGEQNGNINFYRNTGTAAEPTFILETETFASIDGGFSSTPIFEDIDDDDDFDLFVGESFGEINFYRNTGTATEPSFVLETENLVSYTPGLRHNSAPTLTDIDGDGDFDLFVGESVNLTEALIVIAMVGGNLKFYRNTGTNTDANFTLESEYPGSVGLLLSPIFADIDDDGDFDIFAGEATGNINFYRNGGTAFTLETTDLASLDVGARSAPTFADIDNDRDLDLFMGEFDGNINFYRKTGTATEPTFTLETTAFDSIDVGDFSSPAFADIDNDGDLDLFVGERDGNINFFRNTGTGKNPTFTLETQGFGSINVGIRSTPAFVDIDSDGDLDLFVGERDGNINFYRNTGTSAKFTFAVETTDFASIDVGDFSYPAFSDIDNDGDFDLFVGERDGNINFYRNTGTANNPNFTFETEAFASTNVGEYSVPTFIDIDNDGDMDLFVGVGVGGLHFYRNLSPIAGK